MNIGLGSDIARGYALPIQTAMREAVVVARLREGARREHVRTHAGVTSLTPPTADVADMPDVPSTPLEAMPGIADPALANALKEPVSDTYSRQTAIAQEAQEAGREAPSEKPEEEDRGLRVDWIEALYLATAGGKSALGFKGLFEPGAEFDAQLSEWHEQLLRVAAGTTDPGADNSYAGRAWWRVCWPTRPFRPTPASRHALVDGGRGAVVVYWRRPEQDCRLGPGEEGDVTLLYA